jgi:GT2 family glycosyltransferase
MQRVKIPIVDHPRASIILIAWKQLERLLGCLSSIADTVRRDDTLYEVIVVSNDAPTAITDVLKRSVEGIRLVEAEANLGFSGGCNLGASVARGEYLVFLNDDARVAPGWLQWLIETADANPRAGAVGSLILFPDGTVQEAGSVLWADGSTMPVGRGSPSTALTWKFVRKVDYSSACSLLVRRRAWNEVGGFDHDYHPAYYEDVDLCTALRARGWDVLLEPRSQIWHDESASSDGRFKHLLFARNQRRFAAKWSEELKTREPARPESPEALAGAIRRARGAARQVLVIDDRIPDPNVGSGFGRMYEAVLDMLAAGYRVVMHPTCGADGFVPDTLVSAGVAILDGDLAVHLAQPQYRYDVVVVSRPHNFERVESLVRATQPSARLIYDCEALFWRRLHKQALLTMDAIERTHLVDSAANMRRLEERIVASSDGAVTVSDEEAALLRTVKGCCPIQSIQPTEESASLTSQPFHERHGLAYVAGWMAGTASPNADGLRWFAGDVLPLIRKVLPWVRLDVTGGGVPEDVRDLADPNIRFVGHVQDLSNFYAKHRVVIAPIRFGAGVKVKIIQALQHGVPVVSTSCGAEGIDLQGIDAIAINDDAQGFAEATVRLLTDPEAWQARRVSITALLDRWHRETESGSWRDVIGRAIAGGTAWP